MQYRKLGKTGIEVSALGFGCGSVGGLLVRGEPKERIATVARAIELGITYFDTAPLYGNGTSETNLGIALKELGADVRIGTKVELSASALENVEQAVTESVTFDGRKIRCPATTGCGTVSNCSLVCVGGQAGWERGKRRDHCRFNLAGSACGDAAPRAESYRHMGQSPPYPRFAVPKTVSTTKATILPITYVP